MVYPAKVAELKPLSPHESVGYIRPGFKEGVDAVISQALGTEALHQAVPVEKPAVAPAPLLKVVEYTPHIQEPEQPAHPKAA